MTNDILLKWVGYFFFTLLALSLFISKAAVNISGGVLLLISIIYLIFYYDRIDFRNKNRYVIVLLFPFFIGFIASFFSLSGASGSLAFIERFRFFLLFLSFALFIDSEKKMNILLILFNISSLASILYGLDQFDFNGAVWGKVIGLHTLGRGSDLMVSISLLNIVGLFTYNWQGKWRNIFFKLVIFLNTALMISGVLVMGRRGSIIGLIAGIVIFGVVSRRILILALVVSAACCSFYYSDTWIVQRIISIADLNNNESNEVRVQLMRTGVDYISDARLFFRGTGAKLSKKPFEIFYNSKPDAYKAKYNLVGGFFGNYHNSFLQMGIEGGVFFVLLFFVCVFSMMVFLFIRLFKLQGNAKLYPTAAISVTCGCFVSQFFHGDLYMYGGIPFILVLSAGCFICMAKNEEPKVESDPDNKSAITPHENLYGPSGPVIHKV
jgi:hypothetical protein